jgi:hypothetical protein
VGRQGLEPGNKLHASTEIPKNIPMASRPDRYGIRDVGCVIDKFKWIIFMPLMKSKQLHRILA